MARRRLRKTDFLASPSAVRKILAMLKKKLTDILPKSEAGLIQMLRAARHVNRYSAGAGKRGRKPKFKRKDLIEVSLTLQAILTKEASIGFSSFVDHYLRILSFPADLLIPLETGEINLYEAEQLNRVKNVLIRESLFKSHLKSQGSTRALRERIAQALGENKIPQPPTEPPVEIDPELLEMEEGLDPTHLLFDQLQQIEIAMKEIKSEEVTDELLDEILAKGDELMNALMRAKKRSAANLRA